MDSASSPGRQMFRAKRSKVAPMPAESISLMGDVPVPFSFGATTAADDPTAAADAAAGAAPEAEADNEALTVLRAMARVARSNPTNALRSLVNSQLHIASTQINWSAQSASITEGTLLMLWLRHLRADTLQTDQFDDVARVNQSLLATLQAGAGGCGGAPYDCSVSDPAGHTVWHAIAASGDFSHFRLALLRVLLESASVCAPLHPVLVDGSMATLLLRGWGADSVAVQSDLIAALQLLDQHGCVPVQMPASLLRDDPKTLERLVHWLLSLPHDQRMRLRLDEPLRLARLGEERQPLHSLIRFRTVVFQRIKQWQMEQQVKQQTAADSGSHGSSTPVTDSSTSVSGTPAASSSISASASTLVSSSSALPAPLKTVPLADLGAWLRQQLPLHVRLQLVLLSNSGSTADADQLVPQLSWLQLAEREDFASADDRTLLSRWWERTEEGSSTQLLFLQRVQQLEQQAISAASSASDRSPAASDPAESEPILLRTALEALATSLLLIRPAPARDTDLWRLLSAVLSAGAAMGLQLYARSDRDDPSRFPRTPLPWSLLTMQSVFTAHVLPAASVLQLAALLHSHGVRVDGAGRSFTLHLIQSGDAALLKQWLSPQLARWSMDSDWLAERMVGDVRTAKWSSVETPFAGCQSTSDVRRHPVNLHARYVRILPTLFQNHISLRWDVESEPLDQAAADIMAAGGLTSSVTAGAFASASSSSSSSSSSRRAPSSSANSKSAGPDPAMLRYVCHGQVFASGHWDPEHSVRGAVLHRPPPPGQHSPAWCAQHNRLGEEWIAVDLGAVRRITAVSIQGRDGGCPQRVTQFRLQYLSSAGDEAYTLQQAAQRVADLELHTVAAAERARLPRLVALAADWWHAACAPSIRRGLTPHIIPALHRTVLDYLAGPPAPSFLRLQQQQTTGAEDIGGAMLTGSPAVTDSGSDFSPAAASSSVSGVGSSLERLVSLLQSCAPPATDAAGSAAHAAALHQAELALGLHRCEESDRALEQMAVQLVHAMGTV